MLLGDAEREQLYETLKRHAAEGRLDVAELERRVALVAEADTREAAAAAVADLPPLASTTNPDRRPRRGRGHGEVDKPGPDWQPTSERFRDPRTRRVLRVWVDPAGDRHYVAE
ncbi:MAG TPA: DUF1707 domain-containing protein [Solirubrobacteraceae bacterium]|jgi:hypothetical protein|nr:DUF1707 domain-containing protein [Solirubrobacteraceae bacterium]